MNHISEVVHALFDRADLPDTIRVIGSYGPLSPGDELTWMGTGYETGDSRFVFLPAFCRRVWGILFSECNHD